MLSKTDMISYYKGNSIPNSHIHMFDPENVNIACNIFKDLIKYAKGKFFFLVILIASTLSLSEELLTISNKIINILNQFDPENVNIACNIFKDLIKYAKGNNFFDLFLSFWLRVRSRGPRNY